MKKILTILICLVAISFSAFAYYEDSITVNIAPIGLQVNTSSIDVEEDIISGDGFGTEVSYQRYYSEGYFFQGGFSWNSYYLGEDREATSNLMLFAGAGYEISFAESFFAYAHADIAADYLFYKNNCDLSFGIKTGVGVGYNLSKVSFKVSCDGTFSFNKDSYANYTDCRIIPMVGIEFHL